MKEEKQETPKPAPWEMVDPKPPVIQSGHLESRRQFHREPPENPVG